MKQIRQKIGKSCSAAIIGVSISSLSILGATPALASSGVGQTARVNVSSNGAQADSFSFAAHPKGISADGRFLVYASSASNLVANDTNNNADVFLYDRVTAQTTRVSVSDQGTEGNDFSGGPSISPDGRFVAFVSAASNLVPGDTNGAIDVFLKDTKTGKVVRESVASDGTQGNADSNFVGAPKVSAFGRFVVFESFASNLVANDTNNNLDIFVRDNLTGKTTRASVASDGTEAAGLSLTPAISADGQTIAFWSTADNLVPGDTGQSDIFVHNQRTGQTTRVSVANNGTGGNGDSQFPAISATGRFVAFESFASNLVPGDTNGTFDVFVRDTRTGTTTRVSTALDGSQGSLDSRDAAVSGDGRFVAFWSQNTNLTPLGVNNGEAIFVKDTRTGQVTREDIATNGTPANQSSSDPSLSADGRFVTFSSAGDNLVPNDTNGVSDIFLRQRF